MKRKNFFNHLKEEIHLHFWQYFLFFVFSLFFLISFISIRDSRLTRFLIIILFVVFYIFWGIIHHLLNKTLHLKIVVEYILIGGIILFLFKVVLIP